MDASVSSPPLISNRTEQYLLHTDLTCRKIHELTNLENLAMTTCSISQLTAKLIRDNGRVIVLYRGNEYVVVHTPNDGLSDYAVETIDDHGILSQPCCSVAECKDWIRTSYAADLELSEADRLDEIDRLNSLEGQAKQGDEQGVQQQTHAMHLDACRREVIQLVDYRRDVAFVQYHSREEQEVCYQLRGEGKLVIARGFAAAELFSRAEEHCDHNQILDPVFALLLAGMGLIAAKKKEYWPAAASTQSLQLPPGFYLQRVRPDAVHWHNDKGEVSRNYASASEATEYAWLYHEGQKDL